MKSWKCDDDQCIRNPAGLPTAERVQRFNSLNWVLALQFYFRHPLR